MSSSSRPRRSVLYMPGSNPRALAKGRELPADALILDLEDAVAPDAKEAGREAIGAALAEKAAYGHRELVVRVNGLDTAWGYGDLAAMATAGADAILLPKVESGDMVRRAVAALDAAGAPEELPIWCMVETPRGVLNALEIADQHRVRCFVMGTSDLTKDLLARETPDRLAMQTSLRLCLLAARAARIAIVDGVHLDLNDEEGLRAACEQGQGSRVRRQDPDPSQADRGGQRRLRPFERGRGQSPAADRCLQAALASGQGVAVLDGKLVENLHVVEARRLVALADAISERGG